MGVKTVGLASRGREYTEIQSALVSLPADGGGNLTENWTILVYNDDYVYNGCFFNVMGGYPTSQYGVTVQGVNRPTIGALGGNTYSVYWGDPNASNCFVNDCNLTDNPTMPSYTFGSYNAPGSNFGFRRCRIAQQNPSGYGIMLLYGSDGFVFEDCIFPVAPHPYGNVGENFNMKFHGNLSLNVIALGATSGLINNNVFANGIYITIPTTGEIRFYNNHIINSYTQIGGTPLSSPNVIFRNNIFSGAPGAFLFAMPDANIPALDMDYDSFYNVNTIGGGVEMYVYPTTGVLDINGMRARGLEVHGQNIVIPQYIGGSVNDPKSYKITQNNPNLIGKGLDLSAYFTTDMGNAVRTRWDIGAWNKYDSPVVPRQVVART